MITTEYDVDFGKDGVAHVIVHDPCDTPEKKELRRREVNRVARFLLGLSPQEA